MVVLIVFVALLNPDFIGRLVIPVRHSLAGTSKPCPPSLQCQPSLYAALTIEMPFKNAMPYDNAPQEAHIKGR